MKGITILLVEDDAKFRDAFVHAIDAAPDLRLVGAASTAAEGLRLMDECRPDVLLVDLGLPDRPGLDLIRHAVRHLPDCDIMVVTVFGDEKHVIESIEAGATGYLHKDSLPRDFVEQIRLLHGGASPISPVIARQILTRFQPPRRAARNGDSSTPTLSEREHEVLALVTKGFTYDEIAKLLAVSTHTVMTYVKRIYRKLEVRSKTEAVYEARKMGLLRE
ncbi:MAG TPA: response regulator transcription factor [Burkholderiaceae bacterium]|nr:response regulator transcription factor [Burkholderiaceae bacterium]